MATERVIMPPKITPGTRPEYVEVRFDAKPSVEVRESLKSAGFRWAPSSACWYGLRAKLGGTVLSTVPEVVPCLTKARIMAESAEVGVLRDELAALRALLAEMRAGAVGAVSIDATGVAAPAAAPVPPAATPAPKVRPAPVRASIGRTIAVDGAGQWGG